MRFGSFSGVLVGFIGCFGALGVCVLFLFLRGALGGVSFLNQVFLVFFDCFLTWMFCFVFVCWRFCEVVFLFLFFWLCFKCVPMGFSGFGMRVVFQTFFVHFFVFGWVWDFVCVFFGWSGLLSFFVGFLSMFSHTMFALFWKKFTQKGFCSVDFFFVMFSSVKFFFLWFCFSVFVFDVFVFGLLLCSMFF